MIFDSHLHLVDRARLSYPWLAGAPALDRDWTLEAYEETARRVGITDVLHMEVDVAETDIDAETAWIATLMDRPDGLLRGVISAARPESPDFPAWLERVDRRVVRGIRRVLHVVPDEISQVPLFRENLRRLGAAGLPFDICMLARQLPLATALVDAAPGTTFVLDHCGVPDIAAGDFDRWAPLVAEIARRDNLKAKISGITAYVGGPWTLPTLKPYVDHMLACFGPDRLVWGSDSPVCTLHSSLPEWVATTHALLAGLTPEEKARVLHGNAMALWMR